MPIETTILTPQTFGLLIGTAVKIAVAFTMIGVFIAAIVV